MVLLVYVHYDIKDKNAKYLSHVTLTLAVMEVCVWIMVAYLYVNVNIHMLVTHVMPQMHVSQTLVRIMLSAQIMKDLQFVTVDNVTKAKNVKLTNVTSVTKMLTVIMDVAHVNQTL